VAVAVNRCAEYRAGARMNEANCGSAIPGCRNLSVAPTGYASLTGFVTGRSLRQPKITAENVVLTRYSVIADSVLREKEFARNGLECRDPLPFASELVAVRETTVTKGGCHEEWTECAACRFAARIACYL
jgi:hypothetical protein